MSSYSYYELLSRYTWYDSMFDCMFAEIVFVDFNFNTRHAIITINDALDFTLHLIVDKRLQAAGYMDEDMLPF